MPPRVVGAGIAALICCAIALTAAATADAEGPPIAPDAPETLHDGTLEYRIFDYRWEDRQEVQVFHTWDTACASPPVEGASIPSTGPVAASTMTRLLRASLQDINEALRGAVVLVDAGQAPAGAQCQEPPFFGTNPYDIVVGWAPLAQGAGLASTSIDHRNQIIGARVVLDPRLAWACPDDPPHRDAQHTITHELLHALGVDHSEETSAIMFRSFTVCHAELLLQPDDRAALAELYPVTTSSNTPAPPPPPSTTGYVGLAVAETAGGSADLVAHLATEGCSAQALAITSGGRWVVYVHGAPSFANAAFPTTLAAMSPYFYRCA